MYRRVRGIHRPLMQPLQSKWQYNRIPLALIYTMQVLWMQTSGKVPDYQDYWRMRSAWTGLR